MLTKNNNNIFHSYILYYLFCTLGEKISIQEVIEAMEKKKVKCKIKDYSNRMIMNYTIGADFNDPVVREARGIIFDVGDRENLFTWTIVCRGFDKFGNSFESYAANIDWKTARIQAKIDGSILKLYYYSGEWHWATNSCIDAADATTKILGRSFMDIVKSADNYRMIDTDKLNKDTTYIFELVSPETRVVVEYSNAHLYHIGTRDNFYGFEYDGNIGIEKPQVYSIEDPTLKKVLKEVETLNHGKCEHEGFVVCDANFNRIKVKNAQYLMLHHSFTNSVSKEDIVEMIIYNDEEKIQTMLSYPHLKVQFKYYDWQVTKLIYDIENYINTARAIFQETENRKELALRIKDDKFKSFGFSAIDHPDWDALDMIENIGVSRILKFVKDDFND